MQERENILLQLTRVVVAQRRHDVLLEIGIEALVQCSETVKLENLGSCCLRPI